MNKRFLLLAAFVAFSSCSASLRAQEPSPTPEPETPSRPFVARAPDYAAWTLTVTHKKDPAPAPTPVPVSLGGARPAATPPPPPPKILRTSTVTKTGDILRDVRAYTDGTSSENWWTHGRVLRLDPVGGYINVLDPTMDRSAPQFNSTDFEALAWVDLPYFARSESKRGVRCFVYEWKERMPSGAEFDKLTDYAAKSALYLRFRGKPTTPTHVWVAKEVSLPVAAEDENASYAYNFLKPPTEPLKLPPEFQKVWDRYQGLLDDWKSHVMPKQR